MSAFRDDYPQNPPALDEDWSKPSDRTEHDSLNEVRLALRQIDELLSGLQRQTIQLPDGRYVSALIQDNGRGEGEGGMWDLVPDEGENWKCYSPLIVRDRTTNELFEPTQTPFVPAADRWVVAELTEAGGEIVAEIKMVTTLTTSWEFSGSPDYEWVKSTIPLHRLVGTDEPGTVAISPGVWGRKIAASRPLRLFVSMDLVPSTSHLRSAMDLI